MASSNSCIRWPCINSHSSYVRLPAILPPQDMHSCSALIGRLPCPCNMFQDGATANVCDSCLHSFSHHASSAATEPTLGNGPQVTVPTPVWARSVTALFQSLLRSTPSGSLAIQETSTAFRKSGTTTTAVGSLGISLSISDIYYRVPLINEDSSHAAQALVVIKVLCKMCGKGDKI